MDGISQEMSCYRCKLQYLDYQKNTSKDTVLWLKNYIPGNALIYMPNDSVFRVVVKSDTVSYEELFRFIYEERGEFVDVADWAYGTCFLIDVYREYYQTWIVGIAKVVLEELKPNYRGHNPNNYSFIDVYEKGGYYFAQYYGCYRGKIYPYQCYKIKKGRIVAINSMPDLFDEFMPIEWHRMLEDEMRGRID